MSDIDTIKLAALSLPVGETNTIECTSCGERKLSVTRKDEGIVYNCWRASCTMAGFIGSLPSEFLKDREKPFQPKVFSEQLEPIPGNFFDEYLSKYSIPKSVYHNYQVRKIMYNRGIAIPLRDSIGARFEFTTKYFSSQNKAMHYIAKDKPMLHFCGTGGSPAILVEDALSAMKIWYYTGLPAVALLGTSIDIEKVKELRAARYDRVILWLDLDAAAKSLDLKNKLGLFFDSFQVVISEKDPKDTSVEEMKYLISRAKGE